MKIPDLTNERFRANLIAHLFELRCQLGDIERAIVWAVRGVDAQEPDSGERLSAAFAASRKHGEMAEEVAKMLDEPAVKPE
jgi:hypothetical protein